MYYCATAGCSTFFNWSILCTTAQPLVTVDFWHLSLNYATARCYFRLLLNAVVVHLRNSMLLLIGGTTCTTTGCCGLYIQSLLELPPLSPGLVSSPQYRPSSIIQKSNWHTLDIIRLDNSYDATSLKGHFHETLKYTLYSAIVIWGFLARSPMWTIFGFTIIFAIICGPG